MIHEDLEKRKTRKILEKYVKPEMAEKILNGDLEDFLRMKAVRIEFILIFVDGKSPEEISERIAKAMKITMSQDACIEHLVGQLIFATFGGVHPITPPPRDRASLVERLRKGFPSHIKIVHGVADGYWGNVGCETRMSCTSILPEFNAILGLLSRLEFGQIEEFRK